MAGIVAPNRNVLGESGTPAGVWQAFGPGEGAAGFATGPVPDEWSIAAPVGGVLQVATAAVAPIRVSATLTQVLFLQEAGDAAAISVHDINQGQIGDCFLLSSIGQLALWQPSAITNMIHVNANGTETVTLYLSASGTLPTYGTSAFRPTTVTIDNTFPANGVNNGAAQDVVNGQKEIWVQVLEKAVATLNGGYGAIANGGNPMIALEELTGRTATSVSPGALTLQLLQSYIASNALIVMDTPARSGLPYNLVGSHAYMFEALTMVNGTPMVQLGNPWGFNQPALIPLAQLSAGIVEVDIGHLADTSVSFGGPGNDVVALPGPVTSATIDLGAGSDRLIFADGTNSATVANTETIIGGTGNDAVTLSTAATGSIDLGGGQDSLLLGNFANTATIANVESLMGGALADTLLLTSALTAAMAIDLGGGADKLKLGAFANVVSAVNVETVVGAAGDDSVTLGSAVGSVDLGAGHDRLVLADGGNLATIGNVETLTGGAGNDAITFSAAAVAAAVDLGGGANRLTLGAFANTATLANVMTAMGGAASDSISLAAPAASVDLGAGSDRLVLSQRGGAITVSNVETLLGGGAADTVTLGAAALGSIDLGGGGDTITFGNFANTATIANVETITGGSGGDSITLATPLVPAMAVDLGADNDRVKLADGGNAGTLRNVETVMGGMGNDTVTLGTALVGGSIDLGAGNDTLRLASADNRVTVANTETVLGGAGSDTVLLTGLGARSFLGGAGMNVVTGNAGADQFVFDQNAAGSATKVTNFNAMKGDRIALDTTGGTLLGGNAYDLGGAGLAVGQDLMRVANATARMGTTLANGGKGGFVYEQASGGLYYSGNGAFAGGGTLIGTITTNGATPWLFDAAAFVQV